MKKDDVTAQMRRDSIPEHIVQQKYAAWRGGNVVAFFGGAVSIASIGLVVLPMLIFQEMPGFVFLTFAGVGFCGGLLFVYIGAHAASGEAMDAAGRAGSRLAGAIAKAARIARGKNGG